MNNFNGLLKYDVIIENDFDVFINQVNERLKKKWCLAGGIAIVDSEHYVQAIVREDPS